MVSIQRSFSIRHKSRNQADICERNESENKSNCLQKAVL